MRLAEISISGFRGFTNEVSIPLDAALVLLTGPNGVGKTSFMDAILWCVTGRIPRLQAVALKKGEDYVSNKYAATLPHVALALTDSGGVTTVTRRGTGKDQWVSVNLPSGQTLADEQAILWLGQHFNPDAAEGRGFERAFVLQQDEIREFLNADPGERYRYLSYLTGVEDAEALDRQLKSELRKLKEASREIAQQLETEQSRLAALERSRAESGQIVSRVDVQEATRQSSIKNTLLALLPSGTAPESSSLDDLIGLARKHSAEIQSRLEELGRRTDALRAAERLIREARHDPAVVGALSQELVELEAKLRDFENQATSIEQQARDAAVLEDRRKQLASLALEQLDRERCPVCDQAFDREHAVRHLRQALQGESHSAQLRRKADELRKRVAAESRRLIKLRRKLAEEEQAAQYLKQASERRQAEEAAVAKIRIELRDLLGSEDVDAMERVADLRRTIQSGIALADALKQQRTVRRQLAQIESGLTSQRHAVARLSERRRELADKVSKADSTCSWLGELLVEATGKVLKSATPLVNELYARLDIHPTMRRFDFHAERHYQAGRILPWLYDDEAGIEGNAGHLLSSAQLNVLAVCLFFSMNLIQRWSPLDVVLMDDPVQSMDDVHVLGLADTLRSARDRRQVILSTHDPRVGELFWRKLRPMASGRRNLRIEFTDWSPTDGPSLKFEERAAEEPSRQLEVVGSLDLGSAEPTVDA